MRRNDTTIANWRQVPFPKDVSQNREKVAVAANWYVMTTSATAMNSG
ncbi:TPA: hypothetical protein J1543_004687 [Escherichia coli]|nr:hypothetical protein [Escherichia coli]EIB9572540.1 hypothetical protein [Escherichia coli]EKU3696042.1 hypothetical protein [Escherichia coli]WNI96657.1 hypothetical protein RIK58_04275 [Escherichia coli]HBA8687141.1 hypothetical protein [Escherichia coli]HBA8700705.1 hypothetical protein [Escherichia coli]